MRAQNSRQTQGDRSETFLALITRPLQARWGWAREARGSFISLECHKKILVKTRLATSLVYGIT